MAAAKTSATRRRDIARRFYAEALSAAEADGFADALKVDGVDQEIAMLRLRLRSAIEEHPDELELMLKGIDRLVKLVATRYRLSKGSQKELSEALKRGIDQLDTDVWDGSDE